jgi:nitroimidazol reductase NimA-like FMN-containing flavoprotein (pyridoxamine 5'-phosphate oxidase superfamily)
MLIDEGLELLTEQQCVDLLAQGGIGRVGVTIAGLPVITPVTFVFYDGAVVFRTGEGSKLRAASAGAVVAFEIDDFSSETKTGWSVLAVGRSSEVVDEHQIAEMNGNAPVPWADGERMHYVQLRPEMLTGRRIVAA